jgi:hypothetical protein
MEPLAVATAVCTAEVISRIREQGSVLEATTAGVFMIPEGETQYSTFLAMIRDQPPKPDVPRYVPDEAEFEKLKEEMKGVDIHAKTDMYSKLIAEGMSTDEALNVYNDRLAVMPNIDLMSMATCGDAGFPLDQMDAYDENFKAMYEDMFSRTSEMGVMGAGDFEARLAALQNELSNSNLENPNGNGIGLISPGGSSVHSTERPSTPFHYPMQEAFPRIVIPLSEESGDDNSSKIDG